MKERLEQILARYGQTVIWRRETGDQRSYAFVQPVLVKKETPMAEQTPLGEADQRRWTYIGSGEIAVAAGDRLDCQEMTFRVREALPVYLGDGAPLYWWAVLIQEREAAT